MTSGKKPDSATPKKNRNAKSPPKFVAAAESNVIEPKVNMRIGRTRAAPNFFPRMATGGAKTTYGTKKMDTRRLYWPGAKLRSGTRTC